MHSSFGSDGMQAKGEEVFTHEIYDRHLQSVIDPMSWNVIYHIYICIYLLICDALEPSSLKSCVRLVGLQKPTSIGNSSAESGEGIEPVEFSLMSVSVSFSRLSLS